MVWVMIDSAIYVFLKLLTRVTRQRTECNWKKNVVSSTGWQAPLSHTWGKSWANYLVRRLAQLFHHVYVRLSFLEFFGSRGHEESICRVWYLSFATQRPTWMDEFIHLIGVRQRLIYFYFSLILPEPPWAFRFSKDLIISTSLYASEYNPQRI